MVRLNKNAFIILKFESVHLIL